MKAISVIATDTRLIGIIDEYSASEHEMSSGNQTDHLHNKRPDCPNRWLRAYRFPPWSIIHFSSSCVVTGTSWLLGDLHSRPSSYSCARSNTFLVSPFHVLVADSMNDGEPLGLLTVSITCCYGSRTQFDYSLIFLLRLRWRDFWSLDCFLPVAVSWFVIGLLWCVWILTSYPITVISTSL